MILLNKYISFYYMEIRSFTGQLFNVAHNLLKSDLVWKHDSSVIRGVKVLAKRNICSQLSPAASPHPAIFCDILVWGFFCCCFFYSLWTLFVLTWVWKMCSVGKSESLNKSPTCLYYDMTVFLHWAIELLRMFRLCICCPIILGQAESLLSLSCWLNHSSCSLILDKH